VKKIPKQEYTAEFKEQTGRQTRPGSGHRGGRQGAGSGRADAAQLVKAAEAGKLVGAGAKTVTPEQMELSRLRAENARLKMHVDILKKATAYFAKLRHEVA
jgi:transposase